jgi:hypothetical protein
MAKKVDLKAKAKRQKIMAAGGGVLLLAVLAIQVPRTMAMLNAKPAPPPPAAVAPGTVPSDPSVLPTPGAVGGGAAPTASGDGTLVDSDPVPVAADGQLISFGRFTSKDPFAEQIDETSAGGGGGGAATPAPSGTGATPVPSGQGATPEGGVAPAAPPDGSPGVATSAVISVNGVEETVATGGEFPKDAPVFRLAKVVGGEVRVGIAGGALASGSPTVTLRKGKAVTLVNTADGTRYELELVSVG